MDVDVKYADEEYVDEEYEDKESVNEQHVDEAYVDEGKGVCVCLREEEEGEQLRTLLVSNLLFKPNAFLCPPPPPPTTPTKKKNNPKTK